jgi:hypothetical protein
VSAAVTHCSVQCFWHCHCRLAAEGNTADEPWTNTASERSNSKQHQLEAITH